MKKPGCWFAMLVLGVAFGAAYVVCLGPCGACRSAESAPETDLP